MGTVTTMSSQPYKVHSWLGCRCQSPLCCPLDWGWDLLVSRRLTVIACEDIGLANPEAQIHTVTALDAAQKRLASQKLAFIANVVIDWPFLQNPTQPMWRWTRPLLTSKHQGICLSLDTCAMATTVEARNLGTPKLSLSHNYPGNWVNRTICQKKSKITTILPRRYRQIRTSLGATQGNHW